MKFIRIATLICSIWAGQAGAQKTKPNIVLILADDIGFSDIGCYGSEVATPNIDSLAENGLRFQTFYNMAKCNPTRSSLLTGLYKGGQGAVHLAHLTQQAGYHNIMTGKEHFDGWVPDYCGADQVFDHSFTFWATTEYFLPPSGEFEKPFILDGRELNASEIQYEKEPMYKTDFITDYALNWLDEAYDQEEPFFLYLPYHAAHYPLQARPEDIAKYRGTYLKGWDEVRAARFEKMMRLGVVSESTKLSPAEGNINKSMTRGGAEYTGYYAWDSLSDKKKDALDLEMSVFAAMIDRMDQNIGRVLESLRASGELDNTLILFLSDNGSCPFMKNKGKSLHVPPGPADSYWSLRSCWANVGNTPFRQYKQAGHEGGCHTHFIAHWPGKIAPNTITDQLGHVVDLAPTFLDLLKIEYPETIQGNPTLPLDGQSLLPIFKGEQRTQPEFFKSGYRDNQMMRSGDYKIVRANGDAWELYNLEDDPSETRNIADAYPEKLRALIAIYEKVK